MIKISKVKLKDLNLNWVNWLNDPDVVKYSIQRKRKHSYNSQKKFLKKKLNIKSSILFKIIYKKKFVGVIEIKNIDKINLVCEISYLIGEKALWGNGIATKAVGIACKYSFNKLKIRNIISCVMANNIGSKKVLKNNNFNYFGKIKDFYHFTNNKKIDKIYFVKKNEKNNN